MKHKPPTWEALLAEGKEIWAMDFCNIYKNYYNETRPHQALSGTTPSKSNQQKPISSHLYLLKYEKVKHAHGLFTEFKLVA